MSDLTIISRNNRVTRITNNMRNKHIIPHIVRHPDWRTYRMAQPRQRAGGSFNATSLSSTSALISCCNALLIDLQSIIDDANYETRRNSNSEATHAKAVLGDMKKLPLPDATLDQDLVRALARDEYKKLNKPIIHVVYERKDATRGTAVVNPHPEFAKLLRLLDVRDSNEFAFGVLMVGPAATGKTYGAEQAAKCLGLPFYSQSMAIEGFDLLGVTYGDGTYVPAPFVNAFRNGGVFLCDEGDAWEPAALLALNSGLANGYIVLPTGERIERHKDFICIMATNTFGQGADAEYSARNKLDGATLSRFPFKIEWLPVAETETSIIEAFTNSDPKALAWTKELQIARDVFEKLGLPRMADLRGMLAGAGAIVQAGFGVEEMRKLTYLAGLDVDQQTAVLTEIKAITVRTATTERG